MDSATEVLRVTAAIVSAFQTAADTLETIKDRKEKKRRKKEKDVEELVKIKILHKSLAEGATICRKHCENRHQQFNPAFEIGDDISIQALKDVVISLQTEVLQALHVGRAVENAVLDFTILHEASVTNRKDATRAMDQLCKRIMASMQFQPRNQNITSESGMPSDASVRSSFISTQLSDLNDPYGLPPSPPTSISSPHFSAYQRAWSQRTLSLRRSSDRSGHRDERVISQASPLSWISSRTDQTGGAKDIENLQSSTACDSPPSRQDVDVLDNTRRVSTSLPDPAHGGDQTSIRVQPANATLVSTARIPQDSATDSQQPINQTRQPSSQEVVSAPKSTALEITGNARTSGSGTKTFYIEALDDTQPAFDAPEVVPVVYDPLSEKLPAARTQSDYEESLKSLPAGLENIWLPLTRPAMHNRYHGLCKGAWQIRKAVHEGLNVNLTPTSQQPILYWKCKECKFRMRAPHADALPNVVFLNQKYSIHYRMLFLAKSHRSTGSACDILENEKYGCIFCTAQGHSSAVFEKLEHLLLHITSKHKSQTLTREVREKTKCLVGDSVDKEEDWDIIIPETVQKASGHLADEFLISASRFFSRKKGKRP